MQIQEEDSLVLDSRENTPVARDEISPVRFPFAGHRTRIVSRILSGVLLVLLTILGFTAGLPTHLSPAVNSSTEIPATSTLPGSDQNGQSPHFVGAGQLPDLSLPKTVVSSVDSMISSGVVQTSADNLTLYNLAARMRLIGGAFPRDELLNPSHLEPSSYTFWAVEANAIGAWLPLIPNSDNLTIIGTNSSGTFVVRSMEVTTGVYSGTLKILYKATSAGPLKWNLDFDSRTAGDYRLQFSWWNITRNSWLREFQANFTSNDYVFDWKDIPDTFHTTATVSANRFSLSIDLGQVSSGGRVQIDPTVASTIASIATGYTFQRHVFYDPKSGNYWVFYNGGGELMYRYSHDGVNWSAASTPPPAGGWTGSLAVFFSGHTVFLAEGGGGSGTNLPNCCTYYADVNTINGTVSGNSISWNCSPQCVYTPVRFSTNCPNADPNDPDGYCTIFIGVRYVNLGFSASGHLALSYNFYLEETPPSSLSCSWYSESDVYLLYGGNNVKMDGGYTAVHSLPIPPYSYTDCTEYSQTNHDRSVIVPIDSQNKIRALYQFSGQSANPMLRTFESDGTNLIDNIGPFMATVGPIMDSDAFSCVADSSYGTHCIYEQTDGKAGYRYQASGLSYLGGGGSNDVFSGSVSSPTLTADQSTNEVYAFAISGGSILMKVKLPSHKWPDGTTVYPVTNRNSPAYLGSDLASASMTNSSTIALIWTEGSYPYNVTFASIPIETVWSPYSAPTDPWDGSGLAPYGQYFANLGEYVSPSTGMLTVKQTDLSVPGRGLNLEITRVYTEPYSFLGNSPYNFESYPWAPMGHGWQINFPWMNNTARPLYLHLWNGEGYRIPSDFWSGPASTFDNHQGENFRLVRNADGNMSLYDKTGTLYYFNTTIHRLARITDSTGNNTITFSYNSNIFSCITDTVGRAFTFAYSNGLLQSISQVMGSCSSPGTPVRTVSYSSTGQSLTSVADPAQRVTSYSYNATTGAVAAWLLSRIRYPTSWLTNYTYTQVPLGSTAYTYRVSLQKTGPSSATPVRQFGYVYSHPVGDQVTNSTVTSYNGTRIVSYTLYAFSFAGMSQNVTDFAHNFVRGVVQRFGVNGEVPREIVLVSPTLGYTNYYSYDLWGNLIYSRRMISSTPVARFHESFSSYYNDGLPPGFNSFQETFSQGNYTATDNPWSNRNGYWLVQDGVYNGTDVNGNQEDMLASADIGRGDILLQASVYVAKKVNTTGQQPDRVGIFAHYNASLSKSYKWALVLVDDGASTSLRLLDEWTGWTPASVSCPLSTGMWYTFNLAVQGNSVTGTAGVKGQPTCPSVSYIFPQSSQASASTGFGLYAGGYSTLFDNVTVTTVSPATTSTYFSNSFYPTRAPSPTIHAALAGAAELQNGTASAPIENYYAYLPWGGLNQTKQLYNSPTGTQWVTSTRTYDWYGNLKSITDPRGNQTVYGHSSRYNSAYLTSQNQTLLPGSILVTRQYGYNFTTGNVLNITDAMNYVVSYQNDNLGRTTKITYPTGDYASYKYSDLSNYVNVTNENLWRTQQFYDGLGRLSKIQRYTGGSNGGIPYSNQTYTYNWQDRVINQKDELGNVYNYTYDALGRITQTKKPDGNVTKVSYNDVSSWVLYTDENLNRRCNTYDRLGRLLSVVEYSSSTCSPLSLSGNTYVTSYSYDEVGNLRRVITASSKITNYSYDNLSRLNQTAYPDMTVESYSYDNGGNLVSKTDRNGNRTSYSYDSFNRVQVIKYYGRTVTNDTYTYDKNSNLVKLLSQNATLTYSYDARNRVVCERYAINGAATISGPCGTGGGGSVAAGTLITLANGTSVPVQRLRVGMRLLSYNVTTNSYAVSTITTLVTMNTNNMLVIRTQNSMPLRVDNATAQKLWVKTAGGTVGWLSVTQLRPGDSLFMPLTQQWTLVKSIEKAIGGNHVMYDIYTTSPGDYIADGYLDPIKEGPSPPTPPGIVSAGYSFTYAYNGETLSQLTYNDMDVVTYAYDGLGRLRNVTQSPASPSLLVRLSYYRNDEVSNMTYGSGVKASYTYDSLARPRNITYYSNRQLFSLVYSYNKTGTVKSVIGQVNGTIVNEQYRYDPLSRLTNATITNGGTTSTLWYRYDTAGNRIMQRNGLLYNYTYNPANNELLRLSTYTTRWTTTGLYGYDRNGNLLSANLNGTGTTNWTYSWDVGGNLLKVANNTSVQGFYAYDGLGRKVEAKEGSSTMFYAYSGTETLSEKPTAGAVSDYVYAGGMRIARTGTGVSTCFYVTDALGSTRLLTNSTGRVIFYDNYQPYGTDNTSKGSETYKFTGKPVSQTTGLYYDYQRWYDPSIGRFISPDPLIAGLSDSQSLNRYVYASNIPTSETDPSGLRMIAGPGIFGYGKPCPSMFQDFFGSFACSFGITQVGGGYYAPDLSTGAISSEDQGEGGLLVYAGVLGAVGLIDLGVFISDSLNPSKPGRVPPPPGSDGGGNGLDGGTSPWTTVTTGFTGPIITSPGLGPFTSSPSWTAYYLGAYGRPMITPGTIFKHTTVARICVGLASLAFIGVSVLVSQPGAARENEGGEAGKALLGGAASAGSFFAVCYGVGSFIARMPH